jgi:thiol-disulfide isomerase/thioredoxin
LDGNAEREEGGLDSSGDSRPSAPLARLAATVQTTPLTEPAIPAGDTCAVEPSYDESRRNLLLGLGSPLAAALLYVSQKLNPASPARLLAIMDNRSPSLEDALRSGRPTLLEFYAPWCTSCLENAAGMRRLESRWGSRANIVLVNGDAPESRRLCQLFGVDGIPHIALLDGERRLVGTLINAPLQAVERSVEALVEGRPLPFGAGGAPTGLEGALLE